MGRRGKAAAQPATPGGQAEQGTAPLSPSFAAAARSPIVDVKVLVIAALVASPAAWRASQGLLTVDEAVTRFLLVTFACLVTATVVRALWPILAGPLPGTDTDAEGGDDTDPTLTLEAETDAGLSPQPE